MRKERPVPYWRLSGFYFFYFAALGSLLPYWGLYLKAVGLSSVQIGSVMALLAGTKIIAPNILGWLADLTGRGLLIIRIASLLAAVVFCGLFWANSYGWLLLVTLIFSFFWNASLSQFEAVTLDHLRENADRYSLIRIWGSIGFIVTVWGIGSALDYWPITLLPLLIGGLLFSIWLMSQLVPEERSIPHLSKRREKLRRVLSAPGVLAFFGVVMLVQMAHGPYYAFFSIYLEENDYSGTITGGLWALGVLAEIVLFVFMQRLLKRYSLRRLLLVSVFLGVLRWSLIAWGVHSLPLLILAQLLHAATFGSTHVAAIHLVHRYFDQHHQGKGQALYSSLSFGLGGMLGSLYAGYFWASPVFVYGSAALLSLLAFFIAWRWVGKESQAVASRGLFCKDEG